VAGPAAAANVSSSDSRQKQQQQRSPSVQLLHFPSTRPCGGLHGGVALPLTQVNLTGRPAGTVSLVKLKPDLQAMPHLPLLHLWRKCRTGMVAGAGQK
jgi:hypothetical protein